MFQLGIDVSKKTLDLCLLREGVKGRVKTRRLKNDVNAASTVNNNVLLPMFISSWKPPGFIMTACPTITPDDGVIVSSF